MAHNRGLMALLLFGTLVGCSDADESSTVVHDVQYFVTHPDERRSMLDVCRNNPGKLGDDPSCETASAAEREAFIDEAQKALKNAD